MPESDVEKDGPLLISRRREAKRRALLQMLDRIALRTGSKPLRTRVIAMPLDVPAGAASPSGEGLPRVKQ